MPSGVKRRDTGRCMGPCFCSVHGFRGTLGWGCWVAGFLGRRPVALVGSVSNVHKAVNKNTNRKLGPLSVMGFASTCTALVHGAYGSGDGGVMINHSTHVSNRVMGGIMINALVNVN